jgi:Xaa-Pro aminopeptidase
VIATSGVGLYSPKGWGVRAEDMVCVTEKDPIYLTHFPRELKSI